MRFGFVLSSSLQVCHRFLSLATEHQQSTANKIKNLFRKELKTRKLEQADENKIDVPLMFKQGGARIVYTKCDEDLLGEVFADLKESFDKIAAMDAKLSSNRAAKVRRTGVEQRAVRQGPLDQFSQIRMA